MSVLGPQTSHLLLIRTNLGYRTVLTAACAHQGCSDSGYYHHYSMSGEDRAVNENLWPFWSL
jgi:hypothetical protein